MRSWCRVPWLLVILGACTPDGSPRPTDTEALDGATRFEAPESLPESSRVVAWRSADGSVTVREARIEGCSARPIHEVVAEADSFEQRWRFDERPRGPLVVDVTIEGATPGGVDRAGLHLVSRDGLWLHGHGTWVDADGRRTHVPVEAGPLGARLVVPEDVLARSRFPAWLDPVLSREPRIGDPPLTGPGSPTYAVAIGFDPGSETGVVVWDDESSRGMWMMMRRVDARGRPLEPPRLLGGIGGRWASVAFDGAWLLAWADPSGTVVLRRLGLDGEWLDSEPRELPGISARYDARLVPNSSGYLLLGYSTRGGELMTLDPTGAIVARRRCAAEQLACGDPAVGCLIAWNDASGSHVQRVDETGRPLEPAPRTVPGLYVESIAWSSGRFLVVGTTALDHYGAVRVRADGTIVDTIPIDLPGSGRVPEAHPAPRGWLVVSRGAPVLVDRDGTAERWTGPVGDGGGGVHAAWTGERWLVVRAGGTDAASVRTLDPSGTSGEPILIAERFADAYPSAAIASDGARYFVSWLEATTTTSGLPWTIRATLLDRDGLPERAPIEVGPADWWVGQAQVAAGGRFVLFTGRSLWVFEPDGTIRSGPHAIRADEIGCAPTGCLLRDAASRTPFDPALGTFGSPVADTTHPLFSGPAGHLEVWWDGTELVARRIRSDGVAIDATPFHVGRPASVVSSTPTGWAIVQRVGRTDYELSRVEADASVTTFAHPGLRDHLFTSLSCGSDTCWLTSDWSGASWLTILDAAGGVVGGPSEIARTDVTPPTASEPASALMTVGRFTLPLLADRLFAIPLRRELAQGAICQLDAECTSAHCVDGVCCESGCDVADDCMACSKAAGGAVDGSCGPISAGWVCRESAGECDVEERCDGVATSCPTDALVPVGTVCRDVMGACDVADACDGGSPDCADAFVPAGLVCRASTAPCDAEETCDGRMGLCESDWASAATEVCRPSTGTCDADDACDGVGTACPDDLAVTDGTACDDGDACNGREVCMAGACAEGIPLECDDGDWCTEDVCYSYRGCGHLVRRPCCTADTDCSVSDRCSDARCVEGTCVLERRAGCCLTSVECDDGDECTYDACIADLCRNTRSCAADAGRADAGTADGGPAPTTPEGGCGCRVAPRPEPRFAWLFAFALGLVTARRSERAHSLRGSQGR